MDIGSGKGYPSTALSNFAPHKFIMDGVECNSMEGFLQSLKFKSVDMQKQVCTLVGVKAKYKGKHKPWWKEQILYWQGVEYKRDSKEYQELLKRAYLQLSQNEGFKKAIIASGNAVYTHSIGKNDITHTVLTEREFCSMLNMCRNEILKGTK